MKIFVRGKVNHFNDFRVTRDVKLEIPELF
jgi:hypothetical protein